MTQGMARCLIAFALAWPVWAAAQSTDPLPPQTQLVTLTGAPAATQETFTIAAAGGSSTQPDLLVTFTDFQTPAPLIAANIVVTQGAAVIATNSLATPATTASITLPAAVGQYTLYVVGTPGSAGVGTFSVCVAPKSTPSACIASASLAGNITQQTSPSNPTLSTQSLPLTVVTGGIYTFAYADQQFPVALSSPPNLALFQGSQAVAVPLPASPATITLTPGTYQLLAIAQADPTAKAGLYSITVSGPAGVAPLVANYFPVGTLSAAAEPHNPATQSVTLSVTDFAFPGALASASALVTAGGATLGMASSTGGPTTFSAPEGPLQVWNFAAAGTGAGTYEVDVTSSAGSLLQSAYGVNGGGAYAYAFVSPQPLTAGSYQATVNDFQFPAALTSIQLGVAQNDALLTQENAVGAVAFTAAAAPVVLLAAATPTTNSNGLFDVNVQTAGASPQLVFDYVQPVSSAGGIVTQTIALGTSGNYDVTLADLKFPAQFATLALVSSSNGAVLGKVYGGGTFTIAANPANNQFTVVAIPAAQQQYGLYGIQIVDTPPTVTLSASPTSVPVNTTTTLSWTTTNASACTASGGNFAGAQSAGTASLAVVVAATTTYSLTCTGPGGSATATATVTATQAASKSSGGGGTDPALLGLLGLVALGRVSRTLRRTDARV